MEEVERKVFTNPISNGTVRPVLQRTDIVTPMDNPEAAMQYEDELAAHIHYTRYYAESHALTATGSRF